MRLCAVLFAIAAVFVLCVSGLAEDEPIMDLPIYPGGEATLEVNLTQEDILPALQAMLPMFAGRLGGKADGVKPEDVAAVLKDVSVIQVVQVDIDNKGADVRDIARYYCSNIPSGRWSRIFWQTSDKKGCPSETTAIYCRPDAEGFYGFKVSAIEQDDRTIKQVTAARIDGKLDLEKLVSLAAKILL